MTRWACVVAAAVLAWPAAAVALTVDELVAKNLEARGGAARLAAIQSLALYGRAVVGSGSEATEAEYALLLQRAGSGGRIRTEFTLQGLTAVDAFDGSEAWSLEPFSGRRDAQRGSADQARALARAAELDGPLAGWRARGHRIEYLGTEDLDGTAAHKLRVARQDGDTEYLYLDPEYFLEIRVVYERKVRGVEQVRETDLGGYQQVAGVWFPFAIASGRPGAARSFRFTIELTEANGAVDPALFRFPVAGTAVARALPPPTWAAPPPGPVPAPIDGARGAPLLDAGVLSGLGARNIGSAAMSGRIAALAARNDGGKTTLYVGAASGGVWKSVDGGTTFKPVFDRQPVQSIGAIALDPQHPDTVWVGTGEAWTRNSVSIGDGIYKSTDGGTSWQRAGLPDSERIARIVVHPKNGDVVYACVPGKLWSDSPDRGLYRTRDGGKSWKLILAGRNLSTGCSGLAMDPQDPEVLFAGMWDFRRRGWTFRSGGDGEGAPSGSGLFRSKDGGDSWTEETEATHKGLPAKPWGRVEVAVAPSDSKVVYSLIESKQSALYRSGDGGATWEARDRSQGMIWRPFYFARLVIDPHRPDRLWKPGGGLSVSEDGGRSFAGSSGKSHGDWHDLWVDPDNPQHVIGGDDGGLWISWDGGSRWWKTGNLPVSQFYHVSVDAKDPYQVYGGLQDNSSWVGDSAHPGGITNARWECVPLGDGFWVQVDPTDPEAMYAEWQGGYIVRWDRRTRALRDIQPKAAAHEKLRFNWNTPIQLSPTDKSTLYLGAQFLFRSRDRGETWERISPDLTTNDPDKQKQELSGGVTVDNSSAEMHTTIYSISESPLEPRTIWVGTDDGNLQLTRDGGGHWQNLVGNIKGLPPASWVSWVEASRFAAGTAYAAFDRHSFGDMTPWVYRTTDFGRSWTRIVGPEQGVRGYAHVVREDLASPSLLFLGTELGLWISVDGGARWAEFRGGDFPRVAVRDLVVHPRDHDLVLATHGRGIWIVDDISPLRALSAKVLEQRVAFLPGRPAEQRMNAAAGWVEGDAAFVGENPAPGAVLSYYLRRRHLFGPLRLDVLDPGGKLVDRIDASSRRGINRVDWSMQVKPPRVPRAAQLAGSATKGPRVPPGRYTVELVSGTEVLQSPLEIQVDRRAPYGAAERLAQFEAAMRVHETFGQMSALVDRLEAVRSAAAAREAALPERDRLRARLRGLAGRLEELKKKIVATKEGGAITGEERLREQLDILYGAINTWEGRPTPYQLARIDALRVELGEVASALEALAGREIRTLDDELKTRNLPTIGSAAKVVAPAERLAAERAHRCLGGDDQACPGGEPEAEAAAR